MQLYLMLPSDSMLSGVELTVRPVALLALVEVGLPTAGASSEHAHD